MEGERAGCIGDKSHGFLAGVFHPYSTPRRQRAHVSDDRAIAVAFAVVEGFHWYALDDPLDYYQKRYTIKIDWRVALPRFWAKDAQRFTAHSGWLK